MSEKEKNEIAEMVKAAKQLAEHDPQSFLLAKNSISILKARADMEEQMRQKQEEKGELQCQ